MKDGSLYYLVICLINMLNLVLFKVCSQYLAIFHHWTLTVIDIEPAFQFYRIQVSVRQLAVEFKLLIFSWSSGFVFTAVLTCRFALNLQGLGNSGTKGEPDIEAPIDAVETGVYTTIISTSVFSDAVPAFSDTGICNRPSLRLPQEAQGEAIEMNQMYH